MSKGKFSGFKLFKLALEFGKEIDQTSLHKLILVAKFWNRLIYKKVDGQTLAITFEIAPASQPAAFKPYLSGRLRRNSGKAHSP